MGMVETRTFTSGAELVANYARIRQAFYPVQRKPVVLANVTNRIDPKNRGKRPLWFLKDIRFDAHVRQFRLQEAVRQEVAKAPAVNRKICEPLPLWKMGPMYFNQHVVDHLRRKLMLEDDCSTAVEFRERKPVMQIVQEVLKFFPGVTVDELRGPRRTRELVLPRQIAMFEIKVQRPDLSFPHIGRWFGGRDHTTALHAIKKMAALKEDGRLDWFYNARDSE